MNKSFKTILFYLIFFPPFVLFPQQKKGRKVIYMEHADSTVFSRKDNPDVHVMRGNVVFRHENTHLYCDMAYFYKKENTVEAFWNVRIEQGDTLFIYGDYLAYEGNTNLAKMSGHVRLESNNMTLFTESLHYDKKLNLGYFFGGGTLIDSVNKLVSDYGQYSSRTKMADFSQNVILTNPQFVLRSDTLKYNIIDRTAIILGTSVLESDSVIVHSSKGWYNTVTDESILYNRSVIIDKNKPKALTADTLLYNRKIGLGRALNHMELNDTIKKVILKGNQGYYNSQSNIAFVTDSAQFISYSRPDSLFLHADTLQLKTVNNEDELNAFYGVRMYSIDFQGICDSLQFNTRDSILYFYGNPVFWHTNYQISGETIKIWTDDTFIKRMDVHNYAFLMEEKNTTCFNQIKGKNLTFFFDEGELNKMTAEGNTESIYYLQEENETEFLGRNKTTSPCMTVHLKNHRPVKIEWYPEPEAELLPILDLTPEQKFFKEFVNYSDLRPKTKEDIFTIKARYINGDQ